MAPTSSRTKRGRAADFSFALVLLLLCCLFFHEVILSPGSMLYYRRSDLCRFLVPKVTFIVDSFRREGSLPLWEPSVYAGKPPYGVPQLGVFYPFFILVALTSTTGAYGYLFALHYVVAALGMFLFIKEISGRRDQAFLSAALFVFSGYLSARVLSGQYWHLASMSWIPFIFFFAERVLRSRSVSASALLGGALAMQFTAGHTQYFFYTAFVLFFYLLFRLLSAECRSMGLRPFIGTLLLIAFSFALFFLLSGVQLLPALEYSSRVYRANMYDFTIASDFRLLPGDLFTLVFPNIRGSAVDFSYWGPFNFWEVCAYIGLLPLMLVAFSVLYCRDRYNAFFACVMIFSLLFSMDGRLSVFSFCYHSLPGFNLFRCPARMLAFFSFSSAAVAGYGFALLRDGRGRRSVRRLLVLFLCIFLALLTAIAAFAVLPGAAVSGGRRIVGFIFNLDPEGPHTRSLAEWQELVPLYYAKIRSSLVAPGQIAALLAAAAVCALLLSRRTRGAAVLSLLLAASLIDLWSFGLPMINVESPERVYGAEPAARFILEDDGLFRVQDCAGSLPIEVSEPNGIHRIEGFESIFLKRYREYLTCVKFDEARWLGLEDFDYETRNYLGVAGIDYESIAGLADNLNFLNLLNVKYILTTVPLRRGSMELVYSGGRTQVDDNTLERFRVPVYIYRNDERLPRAFVVGDAVVAESDQAALRLVKTCDPRRTAVLAARPGIRVGAGGYAEAVISHYSPNRIEAAVDLSFPGIMVLSEVWYPGWTAYDNGRECEVLRVNHCLRGVALRPGKHRIDFVYRPASFRLGRALSVIGLALFSATLLLSRARRGGIGA